MKRYESPIAREVREQVQNLRGDRDVEREIGSSQTTNRGRVARARAIATR